MNIYYKDENNQEILLSSTNQQVMMEWEKPYMEASIDMLQPKGDVLEIGFGLGYSATQIMKYSPKSYTIIECDPTVIKRIKEWAKTYPNTIINIVFWQNNSCCNYWASNTSSSYLVTSSFNKIFLKLFF